ncbi:flagellin [Paracoccus sanguinis]|uniref:flagellin N-terminal helical domain-containing protein n=1 Tax=Paracoccus sanguinis TaxID=1545044 RepID=UPI001451105B|nr:flagellin [Paracoccus sanguinis]QJD16526.1 flagellar hook protein [Paracoccus sanguinis]
MTGFTSVGDLSRFVLLRQANAQLKTRLSVLSQEMTTGLKADVPAATGGNLGRLAQVQGRLAALESFNRNASLAQSETSALQAALEGIAGLANRGPELQAAAAMEDEAALDMRAAQAAQDFRTAVRLINTEAGGRFALSGTEVGTAPLAPAEDILALARTQVAGMTDPVAISGALDAWFSSDVAGGFVDQAFRGNTEATSTGVSPDTTIQRDLNASAPEFRTLLKGLAMAALAGEPAATLSHGAKSVLIRAAGRELSEASLGIVRARATLGMQQESIDQALARNAAEGSALSIARSDILAADPYQTASELTQTEANLQNLYALTARMTKLSLTDYIR